MDFGEYGSLIIRGGVSEKGVSSAQMLCSFGAHFLTLAKGLMTKRLDEHKNSLLGGLQALTCKDDLTLCLKAEMYTSKCVLTCSQTTVFLWLLHVAGTQVTALDLRCRVTAVPPRDFMPDARILKTIIEVLTYKCILSWRAPLSV